MDRYQTKGLPALLAVAMFALTGCGGEDPAGPDPVGAISEDPTVHAAEAVRRVHTADDHDAQHTAEDHGTRHHANDHDAQHTAGDHAARHHGGDHPGG